MSRLLHSIEALLKLLKAACWKYIYARFISNFIELRLKELWKKVTNTLGITGHIHMHLYKSKFRLQCFFIILSDSSKKFSLNSCPSWFL